MSPATYSVLYLVMVIALLFILSRILKANRVEEEDDDCALTTRTLPPMFGDVPAGWPMEEQPDGSVNPIDPADMGLTPTAGQAAAKDAEVVTHPMQLILDARRRRFLELNGYELKYLPVYADQPDPTYIEKWVWEVRDEHGAAVAEAHEWLYAAIDAAMAAASEVK